MTSKIILKRIPVIAPFLLLLASVLIMQSRILAENKIVSLAVTIDLLIAIPVIYFLIIRKTAIHKTTVIPMVVLGMLIGTYFLPETSQEYLNIFKTYILPIFEIIIVTLLIIKVRTTIKQFKQNKNVNTDFFVALKKTCYEILPKKIVYPIATEVAVIYYGFYKWRSKALKKNEFTYHRKSATPTFLFAFLFIIGIETFVVHLLVSQWSNLIAWILSGISIYTLLQIFGFAKSLAFRPIAIGNDHLYLRYGIFSEVEVPLSEIEKIDISKKEIEINSLTRTLSPFNKIESHNIILSVKNELILTGLYGSKNQFHELAFNIDEPEKFMNELNNALQQRI